MRKKLLFAFALLGAFFIGCSDSDPADNPLSGSTETPTDTSATSAAVDTARWTVVIYGNGNGNMDSIVEDVYEQMQPMMESKDVRVYFHYKYGTDSTVVGMDDDDIIKEPFTGRYAEPGQLVSFEMTKDLDLKTIKKNARMAGDSLMLHDPGMLASVLDYAADSLPAKNYVLVFWGHGQGFDFDVDYPGNLRSKPAAIAKSQNMVNAQQTSAAIMYDEWTLDLETGMQDGLSIYQIKQEIESSKIKHFKGLYIHNCLMGNFETLSEIYPVAEYMIASEHQLASDGTLILNMVKELYKNNSFQAAVKASFEDSKAHWMKEYKLKGANGDLSFMKSSEISSFFPIFKKLAKRIKTLYKDPVQKTNIDYALRTSYFTDDFSGLVFFNDALYFAKDVAAATKDSSLDAIAKELEEAFDRLVIKKIDAHYNEEYNIPSFSLSVLLTPQFFYNMESALGYTNKETYEMTTFHKETGWGDMLSVITGVDSLFVFKNENNPDAENDPDAEEE